MARDELSPRRDTTDLAGVRFFGVRGSREVLVPASAITGGGGGGSVTIRDAGTTVGTRPAINFIEGSNVTLTFADDPGNGEVDITIAAAGGGGGSDARVIGATLRTGASAVLLPGESATVTLTYDMTIDPTAPWFMRADVSCSAVVDVQRATVAAPTAFTSIAASAKPTLSGAAASTGAMTGYATTLLAGEQIRFVCESASGTDEVRVAITAEAT